MKLYKVHFTGYHIVEADDKDEAIDKAMSGDWVEEYVDHTEGVEEMEDPDK